MNCCTTTAVALIVTFVINTRVLVANVSCVLLQKIPCFTYVNTHVPRVKTSKYCLLTIILHSCRLLHMSNYTRHTRTQQEQITRDMIGGKWIRRDKRLAIMLRDGMQCVYCQASVEQGASLTLDHITPWSLRGNNTEHNLITCCLSCNSKRRDMSLVSFTTPTIIRHINRQRRLSLAQF